MCCVVIRDMNNLLMYNYIYGRFIVFFNKKGEFFLVILVVNYVMKVFGNY